MAMIECSHCGTNVETTMQGLETHVKECLKGLVTREEFTAVATQVNEIHTFVKGLAEALNSPMLRAMLPPSVRGMLGD